MLPKNQLSVQHAGEILDLSTRFREGTTANRSTLFPVPNRGDRYFDTDLAQFQRWNGSAWAVSAAGDMSISGTPLLIGHASSGGGATATHSNFGFTFSSIYTANGIYDINVTPPVGAPATVAVLAESNDAVHSNYSTQVTPYGGGSGYPSPSGFRIKSVTDNGDAGDLITFMMVTR
jgi:hypothetical protein